MSITQSTQTSIEKVTCAVSGRLVAHAIDAATGLDLDADGDQPAADLGGAAEQQEARDVERRCRRC